MSAHLLLITVGPVQEFIAQARRTRDLWYGSHVLSELCRAGARALVDGGAELIFPALVKGDAELVACTAPLRNDDLPPLNIANKLLALVPAGVDAQALARAVRSAVMVHWREQLAAPVREHCGGLLAAGTDAVWDEQVDTFVELAASWAPLAEYTATRHTIEGAIAARKVLRDFAPWAHARGGVPKSSLDGARETVLRVPEDRQRSLVHRYRIAKGEQLDAVGLIKRAGGDPEQFVPLVNIALASWLAVAQQVAPDELGRLRQECRERGISRIDRKDLPWVRAFPFDANVLLTSRWRTVFDEDGIEGDPEAWGRLHVAPLLRQVAEAYPYVVCLCADGDRMGRALDGLGSAEQHRELSRALSSFALQARSVVEAHHGGLVYAGGDDVLAFLPLPAALACADELRREFEKRMHTACQSLPADERPTLSVGLGVGHLMESMGDLLTLGRNAEREAKRDRNAVAILLDKRSGGTRCWRQSWKDDPVAVFRRSTERLEKRLPSRKVYEIARLVQSFPDQSGDEEHWREVLALEVGRSLSRVEGEPLKPADAGLTLDQPDYAALRAHIQSWVARMLIARTFAQAVPRVRHPGRETA